MLGYYVRFLSSRIGIKVLPDGTRAELTDYFKAKRNNLYIIGDLPMTTEAKHTLEIGDRVLDQFTQHELTIVAIIDLKEVRQVVTLDEDGITRLWHCYSFIKMTDPIHELEGILKKDYNELEKAHLDLKVMIGNLINKHRMPSDPGEISAMQLERLTGRDIVATELWHTVNFKS